MTKEPPADINAEAAVISGMMNDVACLSRAAKILQPDDFYLTSHAAVFEACRSLLSVSKEVDAVTVLTWLRDNNKLDAIGGSSGLTGMLNACPALSHFNNYVQTVRNKSRVRATITAAEAIVEEGYRGGNGSDAEWLAKCSSSVASAARLATNTSLVSNRDSLVSLVKAMERSGTTGNRITGIPTGIDAYDRLTLGLHSKQLTIIAARPACGKTAIGANIAINVARRGVGVMLFSLEMSREEILFRLISSLSGIDATKMKLGQLTQHQWAQVGQAADVINKSPLWIDERTNLTINDIASISLGAIDESVGKTPVGLIIVDYWQKVAVPRHDQKKARYEQLGDIAKGLKQLARDTGLPVIALAQLRRLNAKEANVRPTLDAIRESGEGEQEADNVTLIHYPNPEKEPNIKELIIDKARSGQSGIVKVKWTPELTLFSDLPEDPAYW